MDNSTRRETLRPPEADVPAVSICIAVFNASGDIRRAIESVLSQRDISFELCIADGGSTDDTIEICKEYADYISVLISEPDHGIYDAWNKLIDKSKGSWVCFLGADDCFASPDSLSKFVCEVEQFRAGARLAYGRVQYVDDEGNHLFEQGEPWPQSRTRMQSEMSIPHVGMLQKREIFDEGVRFDCSLRIAADFKMIRHEVRNNEAYFYNETIVMAKIGGISTRPEMELTYILENRKVIQDLGGNITTWWYVRLLKILFRRALLIIGGVPLLGGYERIKRAVRGSRTAQT